MKVSPAQALKILTGSYVFKQLGFSMLVTRLKGVYANDPSQAALKKCADEINMFLLKYSAVMAGDFTTISNL